MKIGRVEIYRTTPRAPSLGAQLAERTAAGNIEAHLREQAETEAAELREKLAEAQASLATLQVDSLKLKHDIIAVLAERDDLVRKCGEWEEGERWAAAFETEFARRRGLSSAQVLAALADLPADHPALEAVRALIETRLAGWRAEAEAPDLKNREHAAGAAHALQHVLNTLTAAWAKSRDWGKKAGANTAP